MFKRLVMSIALGAAGASASAAAQDAPPPSSTSLDIPVQRTTLANGLRVVLSQDRTVPTVAIAVYYDVGSRNEVAGRTGFAHLFEHMMFQGSANVGKGEHFSLIMNRGGSMNGTTNHDRTNYFETLPSNELALGLFLESDRMASLAVTADNFENQRQTVMEERRQSYDNRPYMQSMLRINELAYGDYFPYAHSTIGEMSDLVAAPLEAVQEFWRMYYAPNNAVLSISGDFDTAEALALVRQYFEAIPSRNTPAYAPPAFAAQTAERTETMTDALAELPAFHVGYHIPQAREADHYALEVLSLVLGHGESSRLYQKLVKEREFLQEISASTDDRRGPDLFSFWGIVAQGHTATEARAVIYEELRSVAERGVTPRELEKAQNGLRSGFVFGLQTNLARASQLAEYELYFGNAELLRTELGRYLAVTNDDIMRVTRTYFTEANRTVLDVVPPAPAAEGAQ